MENKQRDQQRIAGAHREPGDVADFSSAEQSTPAGQQQEQGEIVGGMYVRKEGDIQDSPEEDRTGDEGGYGGQRQTSAPHGHSSQREVSSEGAMNIGKEEYGPESEGQINPQAESRRTRDDQSPDDHPRKEVA